MKNTKWIFILLIIPLITVGQLDSILNIPENNLSWYDPIQNTDSLIQLLPTLEPREQAKTLCEIAYSILGDKPKESFGYASKALELSDSIAYNNGRAMALTILASKYVMDDYDTLRAIRMLQKATSYFDEETHWTLKYRTWFGIGQRFSQLGMLDSGMFYYEKPLLELDPKEAWYSHLGAYSWLSMHAQTNGDIPHERQYLENLTNICFSHKEYQHFVNTKQWLGLQEKLPAFYTAHGYFQKSIAASQRVIDTIDGLGQNSATTVMYKAKFYGKIGRAYHHWGRFGKAIQYHDSALFYFNSVYDDYYDDLLNESNYPTMQEWAINLANQLEEKAGVFIKTGNLAQAENDLRRSVYMRTKYNDPLGVGMSYDRLGEIQSLRGNFKKALSLYDSANLLKNEFLIQFKNDHPGLSGVYWDRIINESISYTLLKTGLMYKSWNKTKPALEFFKKSLEICNEISYPKGQAEALTEIGYLMLALNFQDSALACFARVNFLYKQMDNRPGEAIGFKNMGNYYQTIGKTDSATSYHEQALRIFKDLDMPAKTSEVLIASGEIFENKNDLNRAIERFEEALRYADNIGAKHLQSKCHENLTSIYEQLGETKKAFTHLKLYTQIKDELYTLETNRQLTEIETRFETANKEQKINLLEKEKELNESKIIRTRAIFLGIIFLITFVVFLILLFIRNTRLRNEQEKTNLQQKLLRSQMNPHFIFNALSTVQNSIITDQPAMAGKYLARFSKLMRNILVSSSHDFISLDEELSTIENYLALQKIRFGEKFDYTIMLDPAIDVDNTRIPPMMMQPFIENAIEHGFKYSNSKGLLKIGFSLHKEVLVAEINDNGIGRQKAGEIYQKDKKDYKSMATEITLQRIKAINKGKKNKISMEITDLHDENGEASGTRVTFRFPL